MDNSNNQTCSSVVSFNIVLSPLAIANTVADFRICDDATNDGLEDFDLSTLDAQVFGGQTAATFDIAYFATQVDADLGTAGGATALPTLYNAGTSVIFARIQTNANTSCFQTTPINLFVDALPIAVAPADQELCDDPTNDGTENVDLTQFNAAVLNGQTNPDFVVSYHPTQADAAGDTAAITAPFAAVLGTNTIWARMDNSNNQTCSSVVSFNIVLSPLAIANTVADFRICDDATNDGLEDFDLSTLDAQVLGGQTAATFDIAYFATQVDADLGTAGGATALPTLYNTGTSVIFARIQTNANTSCFQTTPINLFVDELPIAGTPTDIIVCDDESNDGEQDVDLAQFDAAILNGQSATSFIVSYHATQADADADSAALSSPYTVSATTPNLYARIDNANNGTCFTTTVFQFVISPSPTANDVADMITCDDPSNDGIGVFDLSMADSEVLAGQNAAPYTISYHASQADADANQAPLPTMYTSTATTPETIYVRIQTTSNSTCFDTTSFDIIVSLQPTAGNAADLRGCDDRTNDGQEEFDLFTQDAAILNGQDTLDYDVTYYGSQADADSGNSPLASPYTNTNLQETIFARIENTSNAACYDTSSFVIEVFNRPVIRNQGPITICAGEDEVLDAGPGFTSYLWSTGATTRTITVNAEDDYTVTVTNANGCDSTATVVVIESDVAIIIRIAIDQFEVNTNQLTAIVTGSGDYEFSIDDFVYQDSPVFANLFPGYYTVFVRDKNGCGTVSQDAVIIGGPPYFTPNQDGYHDTWQVIAAQEIPDAKIFIFDRFGKLLKQISATGAGWDGTYNGNPMPSSDYWYMLELTDGTSFRGHFALKR
jgi:gliding motility-associated-like protein